MNDEDKWRMDACRYHAGLMAIKSLCINDFKNKAAAIDAIEQFITQLFENEKIHFPLMQKEK